MKTVFVDRIPSTVSQYFAYEGIAPEQVLIALRSDLRQDGGRGDCFVMLTKEKIAIAEGIIEFTSGGRTPTGDTTRCEEFKVSRFEEISLDTLSEPTAEQLISTGRVVCERDGQPYLLYNFSSAYKYGAAVLCRAVADLKKEGELKLELYEEEGYTHHVCKKCGRRYPDKELKICPSCMDKAKLIKRLATLFFRYKRSILMVILAFALTAALGVITPYISNEKLYDDVLQNVGSTARDVVGIVLLIIAVRIGALLVSLLSGAISSSVAANVTYDLKKMIFNTISNLSLGFFTNRQTGGLMTQVNSDSLTLYWFFCDGFPYLLLNLIQLAVIIAVCSFAT